MFCRSRLFTAWFLQFDKVQLFREGCKNLLNLPYAFDVYYVNVKTMRKIVPIFVAFSEKLNFNSFEYISQRTKSQFTTIRQQQKRNMRLPIVGRSLKRQYRNRLIDFGSLCKYLTRKQQANKAAIAEARAAVEQGLLALLLHTQYIQRCLGT